MRRFLYICFVLPALSAPAAHKSSYPISRKGNVHLKSASLVSAQKARHNRKVSKGNCYIFDGTKPVMTLTNVKYSVQPQKELVVDLRLKPKEQQILSSLSRKVAGKRDIIFMVNGQIVKAPSAGPKMAISQKSQTQVQSLISSLQKA